MADKCEECDGLGFHPDSYTRNSGLGFKLCPYCHRFKGIGEMYDHVYAPCLSHDGLLAACKEAASLFDELLNTGALQLNAGQVYHLAAALHARVAKAQPTKEPTQTQGDSNA